MRAFASLLLAGVVGLGGLALTPATAEANGGWRGRDYYQYHAPRYYAPPPPRYYRPGPPVYYRPPPPVFYRPPPSLYYAPPPAFLGPGYYGVPRSYGIPPGPGVGLWMR